MAKHTFHVHQANPRVTYILTTLLTKALEAGNPQTAVRRALTKQGNRLQTSTFSYNLNRYHRIVCLGAGKASGLMAIGLEQVLGKTLEGGIVIVKDGYEAPCKKIKILQAAHPLPDQRGVDGTREILALAKVLTKQDLLIMLLSGGASSLLCAPAPGLTLAAKQRTTKLLLQSGATIQESNIVRKHLSAVKGGRLAQLTPATLLTLIISDVAGDDPATIGSGPTVPDPSTFEDAKAILKRYRIWSKVPMTVQRHLNKGIAGRIPETLKPTRESTKRTRPVILANNRLAVEAVAATATRLKLRPLIFPDFLQGEAKEIGAILGGMARDLVEFGNPVRPPACLIFGGEPTVTVTGTGTGGRVQECMLAAAQELAGLPNVFVAGFGTDGTDGPTNVAGALVDGKTIDRAVRKGIGVQRFLKNHDSYHFFKTVGGHIVTGPTGTNVNDVYLIVAW